MPRYLSQFFIVALVPMSFALAEESDSVAQTLMENDIVLPAATVLPRSRPILIVLDVRDTRHVVDKELLSRVVAQKLSNARVRFRQYGAGFSKDFSDGRLSIETSLVTKLLIEVDVQRETDGYSVGLDQSLIEYRQSAKPGRFQAHRAWHNRRDIRGIPGAEVDDVTVQYVQSGLSGYLRNRAEAKESGKKDPETNVVSNGRGESVSGSPLTYRLNWNDPDNRRNRFYVGATVGTPALFNLNVGFWGSRALPIVAGISGMYFGSERRGIGAEVGWAFDNSGKLKQAAVLTGTLFNGTEQTVREERDPFGRVTKVTTDTLNELHPYAGAAYVADWNDLRLQAGGSLRMDSSSQPAFRFLIQVGYTTRL